MRHMHQEITCEGELLSLARPYHGIMGRIVRDGMETVHYGN